MNLTTEVQPLAKARTVGNSTDASYPARVATTTAPVDDGVVILANGAAPQVPNGLYVMPYVLGSNNNTFSVRVIGWSYAAGLWVPSIRAEYDCTAGNTPGCAGVAAATVLDTELFADTLALVSNMGNDGVDTTKVSPANDTPGHFLVDMKGALRAEFLFKKGTGTSANALWRSL